MTLDDAEIKVHEHNQDDSETQTNYVSHDINQREQRGYNSKSTKLTFEILNIPLGSELSFVENPAIKAVTVDNKVQLNWKMAQLQLCLGWWS